METLGRRGKGGVASQDHGMYSTGRWRYLDGDDDGGCHLLESRQPKWIERKASQAITDEALQQGEQKFNSFTVPPHSRCVSFRKRKLIEVFAVVVIEDVETHNLEDFEDDVVIRVGSREYVLWEKCGGQVNSEGYLILTGPTCGIDVDDSFCIRPCYMKDFHDDDEPVKRRSLLVMLSAPYNHPSIDYFKSDYVDVRNGIMEVKYAVYRDGVEARVEVVLSDLGLESWLLERGGEPLKVYGTVKASNSVSTHSEAKSVLFDHITREECVTITSNEGCEISLPLSRSVAVLPRESTLYVDVDLYLCCTTGTGTGGICLAKGSALFHGRRDVVEERIIVGNNAKVKVKVVWVGGLEYQAPKPPLEKEDEKEKEGGVVAPEGSRQMETGGELHQKVPDEKGDEKGPFKVPRLSWHEDISTRSGEYPLRERMESEDEEVGASSVNKPSQMRFQEPLLELFSVRFIQFERLDAAKLYGFILIEGSTTYYVFRRVNGDPLRIDSKGFVMLEGPTEEAMRVYDDVVIRPFLFNYEDFEFDGKGIPCRLLWSDENSDELESLDKVISKTVPSQFGPLEVNYAVYRDGVEAYLKVVLTDCSFSSSVEVHGSIIAAPSHTIDIEDPRRDLSYVFHRKEDEAIPCIVKPGGEAELPLCRPVIALPYGSDLRLDVALRSGDKSILSEPFQFNHLMHGVNNMSIPGSGCSVEVIVNLVYHFLKF